LILIGMKGLKILPDFLRGPRQVSRLNSFLQYAIILGSSLIFSYLIVSRTGTQLFMMAIIGIFFGTVYTVISFGNLLIPFLVWILSVFGFRFLWSIQTPGLPDLFLDRMTIIWLTMVFFVKFFAEKRTFRGPYLLDLLLLAQGLYIFLGIYFRGMVAFHAWTMSYLVPFAAYFFAKNLVTTSPKIRRMFWALLGLVLYYSITSVAEKLGIQMLIWPKYILQINAFSGRSGGPFGHAPLFGTIMGMMIPIHLYFIATVKNNVLKILLFMSLLLGFAGLYFTYTRGSWLAGIMALMAVVLLNRKQFLKMVMPALVIAPIVAILFLGIQQDKFMKQRVENENTVGTRLGTLVTATKVWWDRPLFGVGFHQYRKVLDNYIEPLNLPFIGVIPVKQFRNNPPHDIYIAFLAETGLVGVLLQGAIYLLILKTFLLKFALRKKGDYFAIYILPIFGGIFVGYMVGGLAIDYKFFSVVGTLFYSCAGIMYGYQPEDSNVSDVVLEEIPGHNNPRSPFPGVLRQPTSQVD